MSEVLFNKDALLGPSKRRYAVVAIANLGNVRLQSFTQGQRAKLEMSMIGKDGQLNPTKAVDFKCRMIVEAAVDDDGNQLYANSDIDHLRQQDSQIINDLCDEIEKHCGFSKADVENLEKN